MKRMVKVSLFALAGLAGASVGALVDRSSEQPFADGQPFAAAASRRELVALSNELAWLRMHTERVDGASRQSLGGVADDVSETELDFDRIIEQEREIAERRAAVITAAADAEPVDPSWAAAAERRIADGLAAHGPPGVALVSAVCKTTICIVELQHPSGDPGTAHVNWLPMLGLSSGFFVRHPPESGGRARTMAYLARKGHSLPRSGSNASRQKR